MNPVTVTFEEMYVPSVSKPLRSGFWIVKMRKHYKQECGLSATSEGVVGTIVETQTVYKVLRENRKLQQLATTQHLFLA